MGEERGVKEVPARLQCLDDIDDFDALLPLDVVDTPFGHMAVSGDSRHCRDGIILVQRASYASIHQIHLRKEDARVEDGKLCFENKEHPIISIFGGGHQTISYDWYMRELEKAGLE